MFPDNLVIISTSGATAWPFRQENESSSANWNGEIFPSVPLSPHSQLQTRCKYSAHMQNVVSRHCISYSIRKKTVPLPLVLIAHWDPEFNINWRLDSIISIQQLQDVHVNIKSLGLGAVHWNSQKQDRKYWELNENWSPRGFLRDAIRDLKSTF